MATDRAPLLTRDEPLSQLTAFFQSLGEALKQSGIAAEKVQEVVGSVVAAECLQCGTKVSGPELSPLSQPAQSGEPDGLKRLRKGGCSCPGCDSRYLRLNLFSHPEIKWVDLLARMETVAVESQVEEPAVAPGPPAQSKSKLVRVCVALLLLVIVLIIRQWYVGGRIPIIREPEKFRVDPAPANDTTHAH